MVIEDILPLPLPMGPHAQASRLARMRALEEFGLDRSLINITDEKRPVAQAARSARHKRERTLKGELDSIGV